jgi:hypothetical protein
LKLTAEKKDFWTRTLTIQFFILGNGRWNLSKLMIEGRRKIKLNSLAGIILFCYIARQTSPGNNTANIQHDLLSLPEIKLLNASSVMYIFDLERGRSGRLSVIQAGAFCNITDLSQRIGHWEIARKYASTLESLLNEEKEGKRAYGNMGCAMTQC